MDLGPIVRAMRHNKVRIGLIVVEIALTLAIVVNCVTMIVEARTKIAQPSGFADEDLVVVTSTPFEKAFREDGYLDNSRREDMETMLGVPGVRAVSNTRFLPWQGGGSSTMLRPEGSRGEFFRTQIYNADQSTFDVLGSGITQGRNFSPDEVDQEAQRLRKFFNTARETGADGRPAVKLSQDVVITEAFGKKVWGEGPYLGKGLTDDDGDMYRVIGTIGAFYNPYGWPIHEFAVFFANYSRSYEFGARYLVRSEDGRVASVLKPLEEALLAKNGGRNVRVQPLIEVRRGFFGGQAVVVSMMAAVIVLLVFVTSLGIVGLTSFSVAERTRQIGTRRALGARRVDILRHFLLENWLVTTMGVTIGAGLAYALNIGLMNVASEARMSPWLVGGGVVLLWVAGLLATLAPALRAARISPAIATRNV